MSADVQRGTLGTRREGPGSASSPGSALIVVLAVVFLAFHLPYLPKSLEDLDSINFALGIRHFDVAQHQPHPPGYPVFILIAKAVRVVTPSEAAALSLVSIAAASLGVLALAALFRRVDAAGTPLPWRAAPVAVVMTTPLYWFTAARPLSDSSGLAAAVAVQAMTLGASSTPALAFAAFAAGLATGLRSQVAWLTLPLLALRAWQGLGAGGRGPSPGPAGPKGPALQPDLRRPGLLGSGVVVLGAFVVGVLLWFIPLVVISGGPSAYWHALFDQGAEDLGNIQMLWTTHRARDVADALYYAFVAPWAAWPVAAAALTGAAVGVVGLARGQRRALLVLAIAFGPYLIFDLLFQETFTSRYALPLVVPIAYLAVAGLRQVPWDLGLAVAAVLVMFCAHTGGTSIAAYSRSPAPAFRLLDDMRAALPRTAPSPVLAPDRRESFDLRGPRKFLGDAMPAVAAILPAPPQHEWLEAVKYWGGGGRAPLWFVVDPLRASIDLVQHGDPVRFRWGVPYPVLLGGVRPNEMDWYRVERPDWYVGEGWALTPESAGVAEADRRGPSHGPITGWVHGSASSGGTLMIGGRSFDPTLRPHLTVSLGRRPVIDETLMAGTFLTFVSLPFIDRDAAAPAYDAVTVTATAGARIAIEQFDASATRSLMGFGDGWHEQELNPQTGRRWRWLSERGELKIVAAPVAIGPGAIGRQPKGLRMLHIEGESPRTYFPRGSRLLIRSGDRIVFDEVLSSDFSRDVPVGDAGDTIVFETDQTYVPAERSARTQDRRHLGLRMFSVRVRPAS